MSESVIDRILFLENKLMEKYNYTVPGTMIDRVLRLGGIGWCIGFGILNGVKKFFYGETIEEALKFAEEAYRKNEL